MDDKQIQEIRERVSKTTPGPWFWHGNTDNHSISLAGHQPGLGVCEVLSTLSVDRSTTSKDADDLRSSLSEFTDFSEEEIEEAVREWAFDEYGNRRSDNRIALTDENYIRQDAEDLAVYQVARAQKLPDDTPRDHPQVYRADIVDVRNANGKFLAHSKGDVEALLQEVDRLQTFVADVDKALQGAAEGNAPAQLIDELADLVSRVNQEQEKTEDDDG